MTQAQALRPKSGGCELFLLVLLIGGRRYVIKVSMVTDDVLSFLIFNYNYLDIFITLEPVEPTGKI